MIGVLSAPCLSMASVRSRAGLLLIALLAAVTPVSAAGSCTPDAGGLWTIADIDSDRIAELVQLSRWTAAPEIVEEGCTGLPLPAAAGALHGALTARDLDADGDLDLVQVDAVRAPVRTWTNDGHGRFRESTPDIGGWGVPARCRLHRGLSADPAPSWWARKDAPAGAVHVSPPCDLQRPSPAPIDRDAAHAPPASRRVPAPRGPPSFSPGSDR